VRLKSVDRYADFRAAQDFLGRFYAGAEVVEDGGEGGRGFVGGGGFGEVAAAAFNGFGVHGVLWKERLGMDWGLLVGLANVSGGGKFWIEEKYRQGTKPSRIHLSAFDCIFGETTTTFGKGDPEVEVVARGTTVDVDKARHEVR